MVQNNLWKRNFVKLWTGQILSLLSTSIIQFVLIWWLTEKTGSAITLTLATLATFMPDIFIGPLLGPIIDRCCRKKILMLSGLGIGTVSLLLGGSFQTGMVHPALVLAAIFMRSLFNVIRWPTLEAAAAQIVPEKELTRINAIDYIARGASSIVGPIVGVFLMHAAPMLMILSVDLIAVCIGIIPLCFVQIPKTEIRARAQRTIANDMFRSIKEMKSGFRYIRKTPGLFTFLSYVSLTNLLLMPAESLLPLLVSGHFMGNETQMSIIGAAFGIGIVVGGLLLTFWGGFSSRIRTSMTGDLLFGMGVLLVGFAAKYQFPLAVFGWGLAGVGESFSLANMNALIQSRTKPEMRGRVMSISVSMINLSAPVAMLLAGPAAEILGVQSFFAMCGVSVLLFSGSMMFVPAMFRFERSAPVRRMDPTYEQLV